ELRTEPVDRVGLASDLQELAGTAPTLRALTIVQLVGGEPVVLASTLTAERPEAIALALRAIKSGQTEIDTVTKGTAAVAAPINKSNVPPGAAVATVSLAARDQLRTTGRQITLWF